VCNERRVNVIYAGTQTPSSTITAIISSPSLSVCNCGWIHRRISCSSTTSTWLTLALHILGHHHPRLHPIQAHSHGVHATHSIHAVHAVHAHSHGVHVHAVHSHRHPLHIGHIHSSHVRVHPATHVGIHSHVYRGIHTRVHPHLRLHHLLSLNLLLRLHLRLHLRLGWSLPRLGLSLWSRI